MEAKFADVLEAADELGTEEKKMLVDILQRRMIEERRKALKADVDQADKDFADGLIKPASVDEIMEKILS
jgi:hypothetical protein